MVHYAIRLEKPYPNPPFYVPLFWRGGKFELLQPGVTVAMLFFVQCFGICMGAFLSGITGKSGI